MHGPGKPGTCSAAMGFERCTHGGDFCLIELMVGVGRAHHPLLKVREITKLHRHIKTPLGNLRPVTALQCLIQRLLRGRPDNAFVIEMANDCRWPKAAIHTPETQQKAPPVSRPRGFLCEAKGCYTSNAFTRFT